jgi:hypothetical protein
VVATDTQSWLLDGRIQKQKQTLVLNLFGSSFNYDKKKEKVQMGEPNGRNVGHMATLAIATAER